MDSSNNHHASYDLHLHTYWSYDATAHVENYLKRALELNVCCMAITEHHVLDSRDYIFDAAREYPDVRVIPSAELTVNTSIGPVDLLCYGFPRERPKALLKLLDLYHEWQRDFGVATSRGMRALGYDYSDQHRLELLTSYRPAHAIKLQGTTHVKNAIQRRYFVERGFIASEEEYSPLVQRAREEGHAPTYPEVSVVVPIVHQAGARVAIAHPYGYFNGDDHKRMDTLRAECALDGIECAHRSVPPEFTPRYREYCLEHGLFSVAGSDCHADANIQEEFAGHGGPDEWLPEFLSRLDSG